MRVCNAEFKVIQTVPDIPPPVGHTEIREDLVKFGTSHTWFESQSTFLDNMLHTIQDAKQVWAAEMNSPYEYSGVYYLYD